MILSGPKLLKELNVRALPPEVLPVFQTLEDLSRMLAYSMMHCAALERAFNDTEKFEEIVAAAEKLPHEVSPTVAVSQGKCDIFLIRITF